MPIVPCVSRYGDLLQGGFEEDYLKLVYKSMCAFGWSRTHCPEVPWFLKTDDDTVHDMSALKNLVQQMEAQKSR